MPRMVATTVAKRVERNTHPILAYRIQLSGSVEYHAVLEITNHAVGDFNSKYIRWRVTSERTLIDTVFIYFQGSVIEIGGIVYFAVMGYHIARSKTEHFVLVRSSGRRLSAYRTVARNGLLRNGPRIPFTVVAVVSDGVSAYRKRASHMGKYHRFNLERVASLQYILNDFHTERLTRLNVNDGIIGVQVRRNGTDMLGFQTGGHHILLVCRIVVGNKVAVGKPEVVRCAHFDTIHQPGKAVITALVGDAGLEYYIGQFTNRITPAFASGIQTDDFHRRLPQFVVGESKRIASLGRVLDTAVFGHIDAVNLIAGSECGHQRITDMYTVKLGAVHTFHIPFVDTRIVGGSMCLEDNHFFTGTYRSSLVAVDGHNRFGHLGVLDMKLVALDFALQYTTAGRFHFHIER